MLSVSLFVKNFEHVTLVEFMYLVFTRMLGELPVGDSSLRSLYLCHAFRALINSLVC